MNKNIILLSGFFNSKINQSRIRLISTYSFLLVAIIFILQSCDSDEIEKDAYYTFTGETVGDYITNRPESFSEFGEMLEMTGVMGLLKAYGNYTCFLPDNDAMHNFYLSRGKESLDQFEIDSLKKILYDHIIKDVEVTSDLFVDGFLPYLTMSGRFVKINLETVDDDLIYRVNTTSKIVSRDIEVHNGVIHTLNGVLSPTENTLVEAIASESKFSLFFEALIATGLYEELGLIKDKDYDPGSLMEEDGDIFNSCIIRVPKERKYGFTALIESNTTYAENGINNLEDMKAYARQVYDKVYPQDASITDIKDRKNSLNRFIAYHLINKKLSSKLFIEKYDNTGQYYDTKGQTHSVKIVDMFEYIETMCPNTLLEVRTLRTTNEYNVFNMIPETEEAIRLTDDFDNDAVNGAYHEIDGILAYSADVERMLSSKRLRMDAASFFPELTNNNIRVGHVSPTVQSEEWHFPKGYIERLTTGTTTKFGYINADDRFQDYQGDEVFLQQALYDFEIITPPVPAGTYEVRFGYQPTIFRGAAQLYWDGQPTGIPLDLRIKADDPDIGYVQPGTDPTDPDGFENDKMMRNRGYMKAPACFQVIDEIWYNGIARYSKDAIRRILGIYTFDEASTHTFKVKAVRSGQFMFDYLEFVPTEVLEYEDIY
ncbi:MAG: fasciclin domain-containing protein [Bacteroidales bacterium]|nr:fasciclin domain-containing protein [Bacteroidales bacterium]